MNRRRTDQHPEIADMTQSRVQETERKNLADDVVAVVRQLQRMRPDALRQRAWIHIEAACIELSKARAQLQRADDGSEHY